MILARCGPHHSLWECRNYISIPAPISGCTAVGVRTDPNWLVIVRIGKSFSDSWCLWEILFFLNGLICGLHVLELLWLSAIMRRKPTNIQPLHEQDKSERIMEDNQSAPDHAIPEVYPTARFFSCVKSPYCLFCRLLWVHFLHCNKNSPTGRADNTYWICPKTLNTVN